jgi:SAM-dependent methyltransferase
MTRTALPRPIDPFAGSQDGRYEDDAVVVLRREVLPAPSGSGTGRPWTTVTRHFAVGRDRGRLVLVHALRPGTVDNEVAALLDGELFAPGWASGADTFERLLTGIVLSCHDDALTSWEQFYRATLGRLAALDLAPAASAPPSAPPSRPPEGALADFAPVYRRAEELVLEAATHSLLDLGTCFGFFPLRLAARADLPGITLRAADISPATCDLLSRVSARLGTPVSVLTCDAACVPLPGADTDTVTLLHVLEHVEPAHGTAILAEAVRLARRRIVIGVPLETEPDPAFGHLRAITTSDLAQWGDRVAGRGPWRARVEEYHGGWLVLDRLLPATRRAG